MKVEAGPCLVRGNRAILTSETTLEAFVSKRTSQTLSLLDIKDSLLQLRPETWNENFDYFQGKDRVKNLS